MNRFQENDLRDLIKEVVSSYQDQKLSWLLSSPRLWKRESLTLRSSNVFLWQAAPAAESLL